MDKCQVCNLIALNLESYDFEDGAEIIPYHILLGLLKQIKRFTKEEERAGS